MPVTTNPYANQKTFLDYQKAQDEFDQRKAFQQAQMQALQDRGNSFGNLVGQAAIRAASGTATAEDVQVLTANQALHPQSNVAKLGLGSPQQVKPAAAMDSTAGAAVGSLYPDANQATPLPNNPISGAAAPQAAPIVLRRDKSGVVTLPDMGENDSKPNVFAALNGSAQGQTMADAKSAFVPARLTGEQFLGTLDPQRASVVKLIGDGSIKDTSMISRMKPDEKIGLMADVAAYNPKFSGNQFSANKEFNYGQHGDQIRSFNTAISHLDTLSGLADALGNGDVRLVNQISQHYAEQSGNPAPTNFDAAKQIVGAEIIKGIVARGGGQGEREEAAAQISRASSPAQLKGVIGTYTTLMRGQLDNLKIQYGNSTGKDDFDNKLSPEALAADKGAVPKNDPSEIDLMKSAKQAPDGNWYVADPKRPGKYLMVKK